MKKLVIAFGIILLLNLSVLATYRTTRNLEISAEGIESLEIDCGDGMLRIEGDKDLDKIMVEVEILISGMTNEKAERMVKRDFDFSLEANKTRANLISDLHTTSTFFSIPLYSKLDGREDVEMFVKVRIPEKMRLEIYANATELFVSDIIGDINLEGGIGDVRFENIDGDIEAVSNRNSQTVYINDDLLYYDDYNRDIKTKNVTGEVRYYDKSGEFIGNHDDICRNRKGRYSGRHNLHNFYFNPALPDLMVLPDIQDIPDIPNIPDIHDIPNIPELSRLEGLQELQELQKLEHLDALKELGELDELQNELKELRIELDSEIDE